MGFLGIPDPWIWMAYIMCFASTALCVIYGILNWNAGDEEESEPESIEEIEEKVLDEAFEEEKEE